MKLSISNIAWEEKYDREVYLLMKKYGFSGVEIAPTRWIQEQPYEHIDDAVAISEKLKMQYNFVIPSMQSIWFGRQEHVFASQEECKKLVSYTKKAIDYASAIGCYNLVFGCPRNRNVEKEWDLSKVQIDEIAIDFFKELGDYAYSKGTAIGMEANPTIYNTNFVNTTAEALELIDKVGSKGFLLNLDIGTMIQNGEDVNLLIGKVPLINHVHISEPGLKLIEHRVLHKKLIEILKNEGYEGFLSIEMGRQEDIAALEIVMKYVSELLNVERVSF